MNNSDFRKERQKILKSMPDTICLTREEAEQIVDIIEENLKYSAIGTVEECMNAVERMKPKKPTRHKMYSPTIHDYPISCPTCGNNVNHKPIYCSCGQKLDWSE